MSRRKRKDSTVMIAAPKSGSGKTTVVCGLLAALKNRGMSPCAFKCGPDYIDPMFHQKVIRVPSCNLDRFFSEDEQLCRIYETYACRGNISVVEGAMGLFDGLGGIQEEGSAYHIATILDLPIVLVVDAHGMGRSILPLLAGFLQYDRQHRIQGVILNRTTRHFYDTIAPVIQRELALPVLGFLPKRQELAVESRHLGLKLPVEIDGLKRQLQQSAALLEESGVVERMMELVQSEDWPAESAKETGKIQFPEPGMAGGVRPVSEQWFVTTNNRRETMCPSVRLGVAWDEAFCFYYEENLRLLMQLGAELVFFSPLHDAKLPEGISGILLGGGYPELYAEELEENCPMRESLRQAIRKGMPSVAECGGFMYLHETLTDAEGSIFRMCGVVGGNCFYTGKLSRFGYVEVKEKTSKFLPEGTAIRGHEFHYYDSECNGADCVAKKPVTHKTWECVQESETHFWGFPHLYYPSNPAFAKHLRDAAKRYEGCPGNRQPSA